jgi:glycosyltransferase involved in cell wall biosynthesis
MITFQQEAPSPFADEAMELFKKHYEEIAERQDVIELDPNIERYNLLHRTKALEIHTARDNGKLIGYSLWVVVNHLHYKKSITASSDVLYISPEYRKGMLGYKFIKWTTEEIKKRNPQRILFHMKPFLDYGKIVERLGGHYFEKTYSIVLE